MKCKKAAAIFFAALVILQIGVAGNIHRQKIWAADHNIVVVLDPGHDSTHTGAANYGLQEQVLNMKIALACREELEQYQGVTVYLTHDTLDCPFPGSGTKEDLKQRTEFAGEVGASLFVSLHNNAGQDISGYEIYYPNSNYISEYNDIGYCAAECIANQLSGIGLNQIGLYTRDSDEDDDIDENWYPDGSRADYYSVIRNSKYNGVPGLIVEHAYMSNDYDVHHFLSDDEMLIQMGQADARGIAEYFGLRKDNGIIDPNVDYSSVFDASYYYNQYPDVAEVFGDDETALLEHFIQCGMSEGRQGNAEFNVNYYKNRYADLRAAFGDELSMYYMHYISYGKNEGRISNGYTGAETQPVTELDGIDYSAVYDYHQYIENNPDVRDAFAGNDYTVLRHFVEYGMQEGRRANAEFDVNAYKKRYVDLRNAFGTEDKSYYMHYIQYGKAEGRVATGDSEWIGSAFVYEGVNYTGVYDYAYYIAQNPDVYAAFGENDILVLKHFVEYGMEEGRTASAEFNVQKYSESYGDLKEAFGNDYKSYYLHYLQYGRQEGRQAN